MKNLFKILFVISLTTVMNHSTVWSQGSVSRSGSTWTAKVNESTVYTGSRMFDAITAACNNMGAGTVDIWNSGDSGPDGGNVYAIRPKANQTLDFHDNTINCNGGDLVVAIHADRRNGITVRNLKVTGAPRYGLWFRGCSNVTLHNINMNLSHPGAVGLGIRVDASTAAASNLTISGNIYINGSLGHGIETYGINGISIGDVTVNNSGGCGLILNESSNATVGTVTGTRNCYGGGYATFRVANNNGPNIRVEKVYSRESGRGFFSVSGSYDCIIEEVDIANNTSHGIFLEDATDTHVLSGSVSNCNPNTQLVRTSNCSINLGSPSSGVNTTNVNGTYSIVAVHSGKALDVYDWGTSNGTNIAQWEAWGGEPQQFNISNIGAEWHRISPVIATSKALDIDGISSNNGANVQIWEYLGGTNQQFKFQNAGTGRYRIIPRNSGKCLDVYGKSTSNGANIIQWDCISGATNQMFELVKLKSAKTIGESTNKTNKFSLSSNPSNGNFTITIPEKFINTNTTVKILDLQGRIVYNNRVAKIQSLDINSGLKAGIYILTIENVLNSQAQKIIVQ